MAVFRLIISILRKNYSAAFISLLSGGGFASMVGYGFFSAFKNPDINLPFYDKHPRNEFYFNKLYYGANRSLDWRLPPVRMRHDGSLVFPYDNPPLHNKAITQEDLDRVDKVDTKVHPMGPRALRKAFKIMRVPTR